MSSMGYRLSPLLATLAVAALALGAATAAQQAQFKSGARTVAVYATVADKNGRLVPDLVIDDFAIKEDGKPRQITAFSNDVQPITVVMLLDRSGSMRGNVRLVEDGAQAFVRRLQPADKMRIGIFAEKIEIEPAGFTSDQNELAGILGSEMPVRGPTPLWNAVDEAITAVHGQEGRRVVLVFSDGGDSPPDFTTKNRSIKDVMRRAQEEDVMVYAIGLQTTVLRGPSSRGGIGGMTGSMTSVRPDPGLSVIAEDTGGGYFELSKADNLSTTFAQVADALHHQYVIGFEPTRLDDKMHTLDVKALKNGMKVRARKEYFAARQ